MIATTITWEKFKLVRRLRIRIADVRVHLMETGLDRLMVWTSDSIFFFI